MAIVICDKTGSDSGNDIVVCDEINGDVPAEIVICDDEDPTPDCEGVTELILTGTDEPDVGSTYSVSGGQAPYYWSFTGGTIDSSGVITGVTSCGGPDGNGAVASVSVTDACGQSASIEVRLPGGSWIYKSFEQSFDVQNCVTTNHQYTCYIGSTRYVVNLARSGQSNGLALPCTNPFPHDCGSSAETIQIFEWSC